MRLGNYTSFEFGVCVAQVNNTVLMLFNHWSDQAGPEERLLSRSVCHKFIFKDLGWSLSLLNYQVAEFFVHQILFLEMPWEHGRGVPLGQLTEMAPRCGGTSQRTLAMVRAGCHNVGLLT